MKRAGGYFVDDSELIERLGLPDNDGKIALQELDRRGQFPARDPLFGNRRYWPAIVRFFNARYGVADRQSNQPDGIQWEETFDAISKPAARKTNRPASQGA